MEQAEKPPVTMSIGLRVRWNRHPARRILAFEGLRQPTRIESAKDFHSNDLTS